MYAQVCKSFGEGDGWVRPYLYEPCSSKCSTENLDFWVITLPKKTRRHTYFAAIDWKVRPFGLRDNVCQSRTAFMPLNHSLDQMPLGTQLSHQHHRRKAHIAHATQRKAFSKNHVHSEAKMKKNGPKAHTHVCIWNANWPWPTGKW